MTGATLAQDADGGAANQTVTLAETVLGRMEPDQRQRLFERLGGEPQAPGPVTVETVLPATRPYSWLIGRLGGSGLRLTGAGHLPPAVVREGYELLGWNQEIHVSSFREGDRVRVAALRVSCQRLGLIWQDGARLKANAETTAAAADPLAMWDLLVDRVPACWSSELERDVAVLALLGVATGSGHRRDLVGSATVWGLAALGWRSQSTGEIPSLRHVSRWSGRIKEVLHSMDALAWRGLPGNDEIRPHGVLFARAVLARPVAVCGSALANQAG
ncbi:MAG: hypothetical protein LBC97_11970 [Bifidobacteriaceae bacterium]|nr:hypothetical protein [Bifidobacteriaceae bacterium]